ncbi:unnamed protein product [Lymnaea stagnalis]|uniref:Acyl-ACP thioesterase-like C-terminal domain-containing protein n=1 Tax=Lymnaea stagnalis TaxID=6523 RepID=A0AAV2HTG9_LYMST
MSSVIKGATNFSKIIKQVNVIHQYISHQRYRVFIPGGFPYEAFNNRACICPWSIVRMIECGRGAGFSSGFLDAKEMYKDYFIFIASSSTKVSPELYNPTKIKGPLIQDVTLDYVGNMSFKLKNIISIEGDKEPICENNTQSVFVSVKTRKPTAPPDWWLNKYSLGQDNGTPLKMNLLKPPQGMDLNEFSFKVPASDVDPYLHVNWSNYVKYFYEALVQTTLSKVGNENAQLAFRNLKDFSISYIHEAGIGDDLNIIFWEDVNIRDLYHFQMLNGTKIVSESSFELLPCR